MARTSDIFEIPPNAYPLKRKPGRPRKRVDASTTASESNCEILLCIFCYDELIPNACALQCGHIFHIHCLDNYKKVGFFVEFRCPTCRSPIKTGRYIHTI